MHGLLWLHALHDEDTRAEPCGAGIKQGSQEEAQTRHFGPPIPGSLSTIVSSYKAAVTRQARQSRLWGGGALWHRCFWDRVVRDDIELNNIRNYIIDNPNRWVADQLHPEAQPNRFNRWVTIRNYRGVGSWKVEISEQ